MLPSTRCGILASRNVCLSLNRVLTPPDMGQNRRVPGQRLLRRREKRAPAETGPGKSAYYVNQLDALGATPLLLVHALGELLDDLGAERRQVVGVTAGDETLVDDDLLVHPGAARVADVGLKSRPRGYGPAPDHVCLDDGPRAVADHTDRLARLEEATHETHGVLVHPQEVGVGYASRQHQPVVGGGADLGYYPVHREPVSLVEVVERLDLTRVRGDQLRRPAGIPHSIPRLGQLDLLHALGGDQESNLLAL